MRDKYIRKYGIFKTFLGLIMSFNVIGGDLFFIHFYTRLNQSILKNDEPFTIRELYGICGN